MATPAALCSPRARTKAFGSFVMVPQSMPGIRAPGTPDCRTESHGLAPRDTLAHWYLQFRLGSFLFFFFGLGPLYIICTWGLLYTVCTWEGATHRLYHSTAQHSTAQHSTAQHSTAHQTSSHTDIKGQKIFSESQTNDDLPGPRHRADFKTPFSLFGVLVSSGSRREAFRGSGQWSPWWPRGSIAPPLPPPPAPLIGNPRCPVLDTPCTALHRAHYPGTTAHHVFVVPQECYGAASLCPPSKHQNQQTKFTVPRSTAPFVGSLGLVCETQPVGTVCEPHLASMHSRAVGCSGENPKRALDANSTHQRACSILT